MHKKQISAELLSRFKDGVAIPAMPLALQSNRSFDPLHQRAVLRYYIDAGVGGIAVGVHSTQFEIRDPEVNLFEPILDFASQEIDDWCNRKGREILKIAGVCGQTPQAITEATFASETGYHACLLSLSALKNRSMEELLTHCRKISEIMPVIGFYLQPAVGGAVLPYEFWRQFASIDNVLAIKMAPFNRYQTLDVIRAVVDAGRSDEVILYTGNDDNIVIDLLTPFTFDNTSSPVYIRGGLLGHWGVWTQKAVAILEEIKKVRGANASIPAELLTLNSQVTDVNGALFDVANSFAGCIPGIHEMLRRQGLLAGTWCLNPDETLSPGQDAELDRVCNAYPHLSDNEFVKSNMKEWLNP